MLCAYVRFNLPLLIPQRNECVFFRTEQPAPCSIKSSTIFFSSFQLSSHFMQAHTQTHTQPIFAVTRDGVGGVGTSGQKGGDEGAVKHIL